MYRILIIVVVISLNINFTTSSGSVLTPEQFDHLNGNDFCDEGGSYLTKMCQKMGDKFSYDNYVMSYLTGLRCIPKQVLLQPADSEESREYRWANLLKCVFIWGNDEDTEIDKFIGIGSENGDVYLYTWDSDGDLTADGHYTDFLDDV